MSNTTPFMELIQLHECVWGMDSYPGRPSLADLLHRPIVVFWLGEDKSPQKRSMATVHNDIEEINEILLNMIVASKVTAQPNRRLQRIFVNQKPVQVAGVKLIVSER